MMKKMIEVGNFSMTITNENGESVTINPHKDFQVTLNSTFCKRKLLNCRAVISETNPPMDIYSLDYDMRKLFSPMGDGRECPTYSLDIYPQTYMDVAVVVNDTPPLKDNVLVDEKLTNNLE